MPLTLSLGWPNGVQVLGNLLLSERRVTHTREQSGFCRRVFHLSIEQCHIVSIAHIFVILVLVDLIAIIVVGYLKFNNQHPNNQPPKNQPPNNQPPNNQVNLSQNNIMKFIAQSVVLLKTIVYIVQNVDMNTYSSPSFILLILKC